MTQLQKDDGTVILEQQEILKEAENFYKSLYQSQDSDLEDIDLEEYVKVNDMKTISDDQATYLEGLLRYEEISKTLYMKNEKKSRHKWLCSRIFQSFLERHRPVCTKVPYLWLHERGIVNFTKTRGDYLYPKRK